MPHQAPAYFYTALLFLVGMNFLPEKPGFVLATIAKFGNASWHIFLVQMLYFFTIGLHSASALVVKLHSDSAFAVIVNLFFCISIGYIFYIVEEGIYNRKVPQKKAEAIN